MRRCSLIHLSCIAVITSGCVDDVIDPDVIFVSGTMTSLNGNCVGEPANIFRPECTTQWDPYDQTAALNAAFNAARMYQDSFQVRPYVLLQARTYMFSGMINHPIEAADRRPPGITIRNEARQPGLTFLVTDDAAGSVIISGGDTIEYLTIKGPHRNTGPRHGNDPQHTPDCHNSTGVPGVNGSNNWAWTLTHSVVEGFDFHGVHANGTHDAVISYSTIQDNGCNGIQLINFQLSSLRNRITQSTVRFNGANGIDINSEYALVDSNSVSHNGWNLKDYNYDRNGILIWGVPWNGDNPPHASNYNTVEGNFVYDNELHGIYVGTSGNIGGQVIGNVVRGNTVQFNDSGGILIQAQFGENKDTQILRNITNNNGRFELSFISSDGGQITGAQAGYNDLVRTPSGTCASWGSGVFRRSQNKCNGAVIDPITAWITGPQYIARYQSVQYTAYHSGVTAASYTYRWRSRDYGPSSGWSVWTPWQSYNGNPTYNFTYASVTSCGITRKELQAEVTAVYNQTTVTAYNLYTIYVSNPC